jgi:molybdenum-dependent DNA-binding transcriptional regulator ModE
MGESRLTLRVDFGGNRALGPGKVRLLEAIRDTGSISQGGRALGMSYRRAWLLVDDLNHCFRQPVIDTQPGVLTEAVRRSLPLAASSYVTTGASKLLQLPLRSGA